MPYHARERDGERRPDAFLTLDPDVCLHASSQSSADWKTEAGTPGSARQAPIQLDERLPHRLVLVAGNADPGGGDMDRDRSVFDRGMHRYAAAWSGEFD